MTDFALKIENLAKKYIISHEEAQGKYKTLRETLSGLFKFKKSSTQKEEFWALKDINLEIKKGEKVAVIGRNGAGKSTLLKLLSRITEPTEGKAEINGRVASLLEVGTGFHPELSGRENIYLNGAILGMSKKEIEAKFDDIVEFSGCKKFLDTPVKRYSSGMRVRLGFAVAAHLESEILIVDEVLAVGDAEFQKKCLGKMDEISKGEGRTIIFVSHNINAVQSLCDKGIVLDKGEVKFSGEINKAIEIYNNISENNGINYLHKNSKINIIDVIGVEKVKQNETVDFTIKFEAKKDFSNCSFDYAIYNYKHDTILHYSDFIIGNKFDIKKGVFSIVVNIKNIFLAKGDYKIILQIKGVEDDLILRANGINLFSVKDSNNYIPETSICNFDTNYKIIEG